MADSPGVLGGDHHPGAGRVHHCTEAEGLLVQALALAEFGRVDPAADHGVSPLLLAVSDNGSQMIATDTRKFMAMVAIAQHSGRPSTPTDQARIDSLNGTLGGVSGIGPARSWCADCETIRWSGTGDRSEQITSFAVPIEGPGHSPSTKPLTSPAPNRSRRQI